MRNAATDADTQLARDRVQLAKEGLGERGDAWWELPEPERAERAAERLEQLDELAPPAG